MMDRSLFLAVSLILVCSLTGCGITGKDAPTSPSSFLENFSLESIVKTNEYLVTIEDISSGTLIETQASFFQKHEEASLQIDPADTLAFMEAVQSEIEQFLTSSGAEVHGRGEGGQAGTEYFSIRYSLETTEGVVNVWGADSEGNAYTLIVLIMESFGDTD